MTFRANLDAANAAIAEEEIRRDERERVAQLLIKFADSSEAGGVRGGIILAVGVVRRGRLLTSVEQLRNLEAAVRDQPAPFPAPDTAE